MAASNIPPGEFEHRAAEFREIAHKWGGKEPLHSLARALRGAGLLTGIHAEKTVKRYASGERIAPDEIVDWIRRDIESKDRWVIGRSDQGRPAAVHLKAPRFLLTMTERGEVLRIEWLDANPGPHSAGKLVKEAVALLAQG
ncbi:hypothetical protein [Zavarzinia sp.]|uniref:hypothetical protein n=1 Tax=Zavarzinia sp. TaxID=2027920 RepID=UPI003BB7E6EC